jgi:hypothetical protein
MTPSLLEDLLNFLSSTVDKGQKGDIIVHPKLHRVHTYHLPEYPCEACKLVERIKGALGEPW